MLAKLGVCIYTHKCITLYLDTHYGQRRLQYCIVNMYIKGLDSMSVMYLWLLTADTTILPQYIKGVLCL